MPQGDDDPSIFSGKGGGSGPTAAREYGATAINGKFETPGLTESIKQLGEVKSAISALRREMAGLSSDTSPKQFFSKLRDEVKALNAEISGMRSGGSSGGSSFFGRTPTGSSSTGPTVWQSLRAKQGGSAPLPGSPVPAAAGGGGGFFGGGGGPRVPPGAAAPPPGGPQFFGGATGSVFSGGAPASTGGGSGGFFSQGLSAINNTGMGDLLSSFNSGMNKGWGALAEGLASLLTKPVQLAYNRVEDNRVAALSMSEALGPVAARSGLPGQNRIEDLIGILSESIPMRGSLSEILGATNRASAMGYTITDKSGRSGGFFGAARQMQMMNPSAGAESIVGELGKFTGSAQAVQRSVMLSGGAFSMQSSGGGMKTIQQWADGLLKFFEGRRPGRQRGKPFTKEELESQHFPGSNIDAWFQLNAVTPAMQDAFWQYALMKVAYTGSSSAQIDFDVMFGAPTDAGGGVNDMAMERLRGLTNSARRDFTLTASEGSFGGGSMYKHYATRERTDATFQNVLSQTLDSLLGEITGPLGQAMDKIPTSIADMLYKLMTNAGPQIVGAGVQAIAGAIPFFSFGDPGGTGDGRMDIGDAMGGGSYGKYGSGMSHLAPSMQSRLGAMMRDNPRLRITSGMRDGGTQHRLRSAGIGKLSAVGQSKHSAGVAADIGPSTEYGWIAQNAGKYGLETAGHHGEPWHVGLPGTVPVFGDRGGKNGGGIGDPGWLDIAGKIAGAAIGGTTGIGAQAGASLGSAGASVASGALDLASVLADAVSSGGNIVGAVKSVLSGDFSGLLDQINPMGAISSIGKGLFALLNQQFGGALGSIDPFDGENGVNKAGGGSKFWQQEKTTGSFLGGNSGGFLGKYYGGGGGATGAFITDAVNSAVAGLPGASSGGVLGAVQAAMRAGFSGQALKTIVAIAGPESGYNPNSHYVASKDDSYGYWQINMLGNLGPARRKQFGLSSNSQLLDPDTNARAAYAISGGGKNFKPWSGYTSGKYQQYMAQASAAVKQIAGYENGGLVLEPEYVRGEKNKPEVVIPLTDPSRAKQLTDAFIRPISPKSNTGAGLFGVQGMSVPGGGMMIHMPISVSVGVTGRPSDGDLRQVATVLASSVDEELTKLTARHGT